ncbi:ileal sodium/bile acid cotransporter-like isoform X2 [Panulirus ornatus]|uniref:ileal sodium/bile acid cotransporter-like isoform X2 n=1 Tax=Panulirus ornatus TaxID=150431 RepID=UPI003A84089A
MRLCVTPQQQQEEMEGVVRFSPEALLEVVDGTDHVVSWFSNVTSSVDRVWAEMEDLMVAKVTWISEPVEGAPEEDNMTDYTNVTYHGYINISALFLGYNDLHLKLYDKDNVSVASGRMKMTVFLSYQNITDIFTLLLAVLVGFVYFFMGATLDLKVVKGIIKKPVGPFVGVFCQYAFMPTIAFGLGLVIFPDDALLRLGLFLSGSCPGGGASNMWTHLLGGSLDLSIMMTAVSTIVSFVSVPLWVLFMGPVILGGKDASFVIPYENITTTVISLIVPCGLGVLFQIFLPKAVRYCEKVITPLSAFNILFTFTFGVYSYFYIFIIFTWRMLLAGFALPLLGYMSGMVLAKLFRMSLQKVIAISVETGVQNYTIALIILQMTLDSPAGELSAVMPGAATLFTPLPLVVVLVCKKIYNHLNRGRTLDISSPATDVKENPADVQDTQMTTLEKTSKLEHDIKSSGVANGGIDNPAADLRDVV